MCSSETSDLSSPYYFPYFNLTLSTVQPIDIIQPTSRTRAMASLANIGPYTAPAFKPPVGVHSNIIDPPSSQKLLVATGVSCLTLTGAFISARIFVKTYILKKTQIEDCGYIERTASHSLSLYLLSSSCRRAHICRSWLCCMGGTGHRCRKRWRCTTFMGCIHRTSITHRRGNLPQ